MRVAVRRSNRILAKSAALMGVLLVSASCGGGGGGTEPATPASITISPFPTATMVAGANLQLSFTVFDTNGQPMAGQTVSFSSSALNIATVSLQGLVAAVGPTGPATITASVGSANAALNVTVVAGANSSLARTSADPGTITPGATAGDSVRFVVRDAFGNPRAGETVTFNVSAGGGQASPTSATTDALGRVATQFTTGSTAGTNTLTATVTGVTPNSLSLTTGVAGVVTISSVSPSPMTPGATVTITGSGFDVTAGGNVVTIDGQAAGVTAATASQITIVVPTTLACTPAHQANVQVSANGGSGTRAAALRMGVQRTLTVGSTLVLTSAADIACTELSPANAHYAVNVLNSSTIPTGIAPFRFLGATSIPAGTTFAPAFTLRQAVRALNLSRQITSRDIVQTNHSAMHTRMLDFNRLTIQQMKSAFRRTAQKSPVSSVRSSVLAAVPAVGSMRLFRVFTISASNCNTFTEVNTRVVYVGSKAIVYEDVAAPLAGAMDDKFIALGQEFDTGMYPSDRDNFGDPLISDPVTDNDGHLNMVFTPVIPSTLAGFVVSCDFGPRSANNMTSNFGENFYARVPTVAGTGFSTDNPEAFLRTIRPVIVHEVKHIARFGSFFTDPNQLNFEESWLEEGMAMTAEEVWARNTQYPGGTWKGNMVYQTTLFRDVRPTTFAGAPFVMFDHYSRFYDYLDLPGTASLFGPAQTGDFTFYGVSWSFIRYNVDRYAAVEATYLRGITNATVTGMANISQQSGADPNQILGNWSLAMYLDENAAFAANADVKFPSWDMRDIFGGMHTDFPQANNFPKTYPLDPQVVTSGDFTIDNSGIHGGSFSPYDLTAVAGNTRAIGIGTSSGGPAPVLFRLVIARIQ